MLDIRHLRLVRAIAEEGGPTRAGAKLHLSQSAVSHQLAELEGRLGVTLFSRVRRRLHLTAAGHRLLDVSRSTLAELARVEQELRHAGAHPRERLRVSTESFTCYHWLPRVLVELGRDFPHVDVRIAIEARRQPIAALLNGALEFAIVSSPVKDRQLVAERLFDDEWVVILPPAHPLRSRPYLRAGDLAGHTLFTHEASDDDARRMRNLLAAERVAMPDIHVVPLTEAIVELVKADLGVGLMSRWAVSPYESSGQVVAMRFTKTGLREQWLAVYRRDAADRLPLARFAELLRAVRLAALETTTFARRSPVASKRASR